MVEPTNKFLVASKTHSLLPFAFKLQKEGADTKVFVSKSRFSKTWSGLLAKDFEWSEGQRARDRKPVLPQDLVDEVMAGERVLVTDDPHLASTMAEAPKKFITLGGRWKLQDVPHLFVGAWVTPSGLSMPHWIVPEWGAQTGGMGALVLGGVTMISQQVFMGPIELLEKQLQEMQDEGFQGLAWTGIRYNDLLKHWESVGTMAAWIFPGIHALVANLSTSLSYLLCGGAESDSPPILSKPFTMALPVSVPPYPTSCNVNAPKVEIYNLSRELMKSVFFHDISLEDKKIWVQGTDGLVGVVTGSGNSYDMAQSRVLSVAASLQLPQKQYRTDIGAGLGSVLVGLEHLGLY